jgi:hypothetical protein
MAGELPSFRPCDPWKFQRESIKPPMGRRSSMSSANTAISSSQALLMGIFALHNLEEIISIRQEAALYESHLSALGVDRSWYRQDRMELATGLLTALCHGLSRNIDHPANTRQAFLGTAVAGALGGNAPSHMGRALTQRRYNGGLATSVVMLPVAMQVLRSVKKRDLLTGRQVAAAAVTGNALALPLIALALTAARKARK